MPKSTSLPISCDTFSNLSCYRVSFSLISAALLRMSPITEMNHLLRETTRVRLAGFNPRKLDLRFSGRCDGLRSPR